MTKGSFDPKLPVPGQTNDPANNLYFLDSLMQRQWQRLDELFKKNHSDIAKLQSPPVVRVVKTADQTLSAATATKITFDTVTFDTGGYWASNKYTPIVPGYYRFTAVLQFDVAGTAGDIHEVYVYKTGSLYVTSYILAPNTASTTSVMVSGTAKMSGTDYLEVFAYRTGAGKIIGVDGYDYFSAEYIGNG